MSWRSWFVAFVLFSLGGSQAWAFDDAIPDWLAATLAKPTTVEVGEAAAVVLLDQTTVSFDTDGVMTSTRHFAVRVLSAAGANAAKARVYYSRDSQKVDRTKSWLIRKGEVVKNSEGREWYDMAFDSTGTLYTDERFKFIARDSEAAVSDVFAAETVVTGAELLSEASYSWDWKYPVVEESFTVQVPAGFAIQPTLRGAAVLTTDRSADGRSETWTLRDRPRVPDEPYAPKRNPDFPSLLVRLAPAAGGAAFKPVAFKTWAELGNWIQSLNTGQRDTSPALAAMARQVTAGCGDDLAKIRALGHFVQGLRYVEYDTGLGKGLGYRCRKASDVFAQRYGDCKDKSNLLCAMLREVGVTAYLAIAQADKDSEIVPDFPSPRQFNHAIVAVKVADSVDLPVVVATKRLGRLMFFDPTAEFTLVGDLPHPLQGTQVFVGEAGNDELIELPVIPPEQGYLFERKVALQLSASGEFTGTVSILGQGQAGAEMRADLYEASTADELKKFAIRLLGGASRGADLRDIARKDTAATGQCGVEFAIARKSYLQQMPGSLAVAKLDILARGGLPTLSAPDRHTPLALEPLAFDDEVELSLPAGYSPEEVPAATSLVSAYGRYERKFKQAGGKLTLVRHLVLNRQIVPAADYPKLKKFFSDLARADRASVLLRVGAPGGSAPAASVAK